MAYEKVRWGIIGCGNIAKKFAESLDDLDDAELVAVGSRKQETADAWADKNDLQVTCHASYQALVDDDQVDAVYVATPHPMHKDCAILALEAGKPVLCEKPFTINAAEARAVIDVARKNGLFCMEAMWPRFMPTLTKTRELLAEGAIGEVRQVHAHFGFRATWHPKSRLLDLALGGGGLLDVGAYTVSMAHMVLGTPSKVVGLARIGETGVDEDAGMVLAYETGQIAVLSCAVRTTLVGEARIFGADGSIHLPRFWCGGKIVLARQGEDAEEIAPEIVGGGFHYQVAEVARCLRAGKTESDIMPLDESVAIMNTMDQLRTQWGLKYPTE